MSTLQWLESLTFHGRSDVYQRWLAGLRAPPRIAWYPAAGEDLRDLLYLTEAYAQRQPGNLGADVSDPAPPDLFLHTDYFPWKDSTFLRRFGPGSLLRDDGYTQVRVIEAQSLHRWDLPDDPKIVHFPRAPGSPSLWFFAMVQVTSHKLGTYVRPLLYATVENNIFYHEVLQAWDVQLTHILRVGYGGGFGGGWDRGDWLDGVLEPRGTELFVADHGPLPAEVLARRRLVPYRHVGPLGWGPKTGVYWYRRC